MNKVPEYFDKASSCMMTYQLIEESLRSILGRMDLFIWIKIQTDFHYDVDSKLDSYSNHAMGRLIALFKVYEKDKAFIKRLNKIKEKRDEVAHRCFLIDVKKLHDGCDPDSEDANLIEELEEANSEAKSVANELLKRFSLIDQKLSEQGIAHNVGKRSPLS